MKSVKNHNAIGASIVRKLRTNKLSNGMPFMIHVKELASNQCYYEFPNGVIELVSIITPKEMSTIKTLTKSEANRLRKQLDFEVVK